MPELPTLGEPPKKSPVGKVIAIAAVAGLSAGFIFWLTRKTPEPPAPPAPPPVAVSEVAQPAVPPPPADPLIAAGLKRAQVSLHGPLETALVESVGRDVGEALTQVVTRALVWWVQVPADLRKGDAVDVLFQPRAGEEPLVHAVRLTSQKHDKTFEAFRFQPPGAAFARFFTPSGEELEERLEDAPLDEYEQITSLLRDGRRHKGVDFKTPVGTPVKATFFGTITRKNWSFRANGNCLELSEAGGRRKAVFLHLSELPRSLRVGQRVAKGDVIAQSGNSGRSFAPHLHYQLENASGKVMDPFQSHKSFRRSVLAAHKPLLEAEIRRLQGLLAPALSGP
ncbi:MAG: M23 family metallopeptidase [Myxococcota bacterium]